MAKVSIYTLRSCPFCVRAMALLDARGQAYEETDVSADPAARAAVSRRTGHPTFPQIFIDDVFVGGCDDLQALDRSGRLDAMLAG